VKSAATRSPWEAAETDAPVPAEAEEKRQEEADAEQKAELEAAEGRRRRGQMVWVCAGLAALPALVAAARSIGADWTPASDYAPIEVRVRDVFSTHPPVVGAHSRLGGNHPGPALFYVLAVPYRLLGSQPWSLLVSGALLNATWVALAVRIAGRRGRVGLAALVAVLTLACIWGLGTEHLRDVWNPRFPLFAFLLGAVAAWGAMVGSRWCLPIVVTCASFAVQSHVGYGALAGALVIWGAVATWRHRAEWSAWRAPVVAAVLLGGLMWAPPLSQQLLGDEPNLTRIVAQAGDTGEPKYGLGGVEDLLLPHLGPVPAWYRVTPEDPFELRGRTGLPIPPLGLLAFAAGVAVAARRRHHDALVLAAITGSLWAAGAWSIAQLSGLPAPYLYRWVRVLGLLLWASALWPLGCAAVDLARQWRAHGAGEAPMPVPTISTTQSGRMMMLATGLAVGFVAVAVAAGELATPFEEYRENYRQTAIVADATFVAVDAELASGSTVEVVSGGRVVFTAPAVVAELERAGYGVLIDAGEGAVWGGHRTPGAGRPDLIVLVTTEDRPAEADSLRRVATVDMLTPEQRRTWESLPAERRCAEIEADTADADAPMAEVERCRTRAELSRLDHLITVWIGPPSP